MFSPLVCLENKNRWKKREGAFQLTPDRKNLELKMKSWDVPKVLLSGDHKKIEEWRKKHGK